MTSAQMSALTSLEIVDKFVVYEDGKRYSVMRTPTNVIGLVDDEPLFVTDETLDSVETSYWQACGDLLIVLKRTSLEQGDLK